MLPLYTLLITLFLVECALPIPRLNAQAPRIQVVQEGGCSDTDPFFRIRGQAFDLPTDPNIRPRWTLPGPPPEVRDNREFLDLSQALNTDRTYVFELIDSRSGSSVFRAETTLTLRRPQPVPFTWSPNPICIPTQTVVFQVQSNPNWNYSWNIEGERSGSQIEHRFSRAGTFEVEVFTRRDDNGCPTPISRQTIRVNQDSKPTIEALHTLGCSSELDGRAEYTFVIRSDVPVAERLRWSWTFDRSHPVIVERADTLRVRLPSGPFAVQYQLTSTEGCAGDSLQTFNLTTREHPLPVLQRIPERSVYCAGETVILRNGTLYLEEQHRGNTSIFRYGRPWINPFIEDHEFSSDIEEHVSLELRIYDHVRIGTQQCIWSAPPSDFRVVGPPPDFEADNRSRGICAVPATSEIRIRNPKPGARYTWTIFDEDGNVVPGFPRTVTDEELLLFQVTQMPQIYAVQLEEETAFGCRMRRIKPAFVISAGNLEADFVIKDPNENPDFLFCRLTPPERVRFVSTSRPRPHGLELSWYHYTGNITTANPDGYTKFGEGDSIDWRGVAPGIESIKLRISNYGQCMDSTYREQAVTFIAPDWGVQIEPAAGCAPKTHRITAYDKGTFPSNFPVATSFVKINGFQNFRQIDNRTIEVEFTDDLQGIQIQFRYGFENTSCGDGFDFWLTSGVGTRISSQQVGCVGAEGRVTSETNLANPPTRFVWLIEGDAQVERLEETENLFRFRTIDSRPFRIGQQVFLEHASEACSSAVAWSGWMQADDFPISLSVVGDATKECIPALFNFALEGQNIREVRWSWGNSQPDEVTQIGQAAHTYNDSLGGNYTVTVEARNDKGCISRDEVNVQVVVPLPTFRFTPDTRVLCNGEELRITNETEDPILDLVIDWGDDAPILNRTNLVQGETLTHLYRWTGADVRSITLRYVADLGKCRPVVGIRPLEIQPQFRVGLTPIEPMCLQSDVVAVASSETPDLVGYRWELLPETAAQEALQWATTETTAPQNTLLARKPGTWPVRVVGIREIQNPGETRRCEAADTLEVVVIGNETEIVPWTAPRPCFRDAVRIESSNTTGQLYVWTIGNNPPVETGSQPWIDWTFERGGRYDVRLEVVDARGCTLRAEVADYIEVVEPTWPEPPTSERPLLCAAETLRIRTPGLPDGTPVRWRITRRSDDALLDEGWSASALPFTLEWPLPTGLGGDAVQVELQAELLVGCLTQAAVLEVGVPVPVQFGLELSYSQGPCPPTELRARLLDPVAQGIRWDADADGQIDAQGNAFTWALNIDGGLNRTLRIEATNPAGCPADTSLSLNLQAKPELVPAINSPVCVGTTEDLAVAAVDNRPLPTVTWRIADGMPETGAMVSYTWQERGRYPVEVSALDANGCPAEAEQEVVVQGPRAGFEANQPMAPDTLFFPPPVRIEIRNRATDATQTFWKWDHLLAPSDEPSIELPRQAGRYSLLQVVRDDLGCFDSLLKEFILEPVQLQVSNVFTPNDDGINDLWQVIYSGEGFTRVWVYDRSGVLVFQKQGQSLSWDGRYGGRDVPAGVYFWRVQTPVYDRTGSLTLVR
jgi:gliding motility-associated-like protein